ncbi:hypothetical protein PMAYCL1PPCAC_02911, partial [Pristionchus mayeri]
PHLLSPSPLHFCPFPSSRTVDPHLMIPLLLALLPLITLLIGCAHKSTKAPSATPQFQFKSSSQSSKGIEVKSESTQKSSDRMEESSTGGSKEKEQEERKEKEKEKGVMDSKKGAPISTPKKIIEPKTKELNEKEKTIAAGAKKDRNEYPTFDDVHSDWEGPLGEMHGGEKKAVE